MAEVITADLMVVGMADIAKNLCPLCNNKGHTHNADDKNDTYCKCKIGHQLKSLELERPYNKFISDKEFAKLLKFKAFW